MRCTSCGNDCAYHIRVSYGKSGRLEYCDRCGNMSVPYTPDVYWPGHPYKSEHITDSVGNSILMESKAHKARLMKERDMSECGDRIHGARELPKMKSWYDAYSKTSAYRKR